MGSPYVPRKSHGSGTPTRGSNAPSPTATKAFARATLLVLSAFATWQKCRAQQFNLLLALSAVMCFARSCRMVVLISQFSPLVANG